MKQFKQILVAGLATVALAIPAFATAPAKDIVGVAAGNKDFTTLVSLVKKAGLVEVLQGDGPFTVFAPTNKAFAKLPKATLKAVSEDKELLKRVLLYHVVPGKVTSKDVVKVKSADTALDGADVHVSVKRGTVYINKSKVTAVDVMASNGVIHVIDSVLIPPKGAGLRASSQGVCTDCAAGK